MLQFLPRVYALCDGLWSECVLVFYHSNRSLIKTSGFVSVCGAGSVSDKATLREFLALT